MSDIEIQPTGPSRMLNAEPCPCCGDKFRLSTFTDGAALREARQEMARRINNSPALAELLESIRALEAAEAAERDEQRKAGITKRIEMAGKIPRYDASSYVTDGLRLV